MEAIFRDLSTAIFDLQLELALTGLLVFGLFLAGWWLRHWSFNKRLKAQRIHHQVTQEKATDAANFWQGISTELFGAVITTVCFGIVLLIFQQFQTIQNRKAELILQMGSPDNGFAVEATRQLASLGWLQDGSVEGAYLVKANLADADLSQGDLDGVEMSYAQLIDAKMLQVQLMGADLTFSNFQDVRMSRANLVGANFRLADLKNVILTGSNMERTNLNAANLEGATLAGVNLDGAILTNANLRNVQITLPQWGDAIFSHDTYLPDNSRYNPWDDSGLDQVLRFTDPTHPDFWDPCIEVDNYMWCDDEE